MIKNIKISICDRCGESVEMDADVSLDKVPSSWCILERLNYPYGSVILCPTCDKAFKNFLGEL